MNTAGRPHRNPGDPPVKPSEVIVEGEPLVEMFFRHKVILTITDGLRVEYGPGKQLVPEEFAGHRYLKDHGVELVGKVEVEEKPETETEVEEKPETDPIDDVVDDIVDQQVDDVIEQAVNQQPAPRKGKKR